MVGDKQPLGGSCSNVLQPSSLLGVALAAQAALAMLARSRDKGGERVWWDGQPDAGLGPGHLQTPGSLTG